MSNICEHYTKEFESFRQRENGEIWISMLRKAALSRFIDLGFPTTRLEDWKYTNVSSISDVPFTLYSGKKFVPPNISQMPFFKFPGNRLAFINGSFAEELSLPELRDGVIIESFSKSLVSYRNKIEPHLTHYAGYADRAFVALNTAFMNDGAFIYIPDGKVMENPIYIINISVMPPDAFSFYPRNLILLGRSSQATVVEVFVSSFDSNYLTNSVSEIVVGENAILDHYKMQRESQAAFHIASTNVTVKRDASFSSHSIAMGGSIARNEIHVLLDGEGGNTVLNGLYLTDGTQHIDNHTRIEHIKPRCRSRELYKGVLGGRSRAVFGGKVFVHKDAFKTDAQQVNKTLLLSDDAHVDATPQLEIYADDVKCSHGAAVGQLDAEALFYLRSRGIPQDEAKSLLTQAFAGEIIDSVKIYLIKEHLSQCVASRFKKSKEVVMAR